MILREFILKIWNSTLVRFMLVGVVNTVFGTTIMFVLYNVAHCTYWQSSFANYFFGSILSFFLNKFFTFQSKKYSLGEVIRFALNILVCYGVAYGLAERIMLFLLKDCTVIFRENISMAVGMVLFVGLNYLGQRFFAFRKTNSDE